MEGKQEGFFLHICYCREKVSKLFSVFITSRVAIRKLKHSEENLYWILPHFLIRAVNIDRSHWGYPSLCVLNNMENFRERDLDTAPSDWGKDDGMLDQHKLSESLLTRNRMTVTSWGKQKSWIFGDMTTFSTSNTQKYHPFMGVSFSNFLLWVIMQLSSFFSNIFLFCFLIISWNNYHATVCSLSSVVISGNLSGKKTASSNFARIWGLGWTLQRKKAS